jgi:hypothetical protein
MKTFEQALRENLEAQPKQRRRARRLLEALDARPSRRRDRMLARMEAHARAETGFKGKDWGAVDWKTILGSLLEMLLKLLPLLLL